MNIGRGRCIGNSSQFVSAREDTLRCEPEAKVSNIVRTKVTFWKIEF